MINALPSDKNQPNGSVTPVPSSVPTSASPISSISTPSPVASQPHGSVSNLSQGLSAKIQGSDPSGIPGAVSTPTMPSSQPDKGMDPAFNPKKAPFKFNAKGLMAALVLGLVIVGGGAGYYLTQQNQDIRQEAASEEVTNTERSRTATEWGIFNQQWNSLMADPQNEWESYVRFAQGEGARYDCNSPIMTVGSETLYGCDLNAYFVIYNTPSYARAEAISPQDSELNQVLDKLVTDSGMMQKAAELGMLTLDETTFNSSNKDIFARFEALRGIRPQLESQFVKTYDFEFISIYFHNEIEPEIPLAEAQTAAKRKMDVLYQRLNSGEITMEQAGNEIKANSIQGDDTGISLAQMDRLYVQNAYGSILDKAFADPVFTDASLDEEIKSLGEGQMSTVRLCKDQKFTKAQFEANPASIIDAPFVDSCYIIFKVNKINLGLNEAAPAENTDQFNENIKNEYKSETTINTENL